ncbi:DUF4352 domain-containing protein [bacterium LRH843]|nr:DUF4352 domain-containing protein [bacterium LRH843]
MKVKVLLLLGLSLIFIVIVGYYRSDFDGVQLPIASGSETREVNGLKITLNDARIDSVEGENQIVIVDVTLANVKNTVHEFSTYKMTLVDQEGYAYDHVSYVKTKGLLGGQLHPDRSNRGEIAFSVPKGTEYELVYTDHLRTGQVTWNVSVKGE